MLKRFLLAACLAVSAALPAFATSVLPLDLGQVIDQSAVAFQGTVLDNRSGRDPQTGMLVTMTTFRVDDVLKGNVPATYTVKQIGGEDAATGMRFKAMGVPTFAVGQSYVVFMAGVSSAGFSSPIGLSQGRFQVVDGEAGPEVENGRDFREMTANLPSLELPPQAKAKAAADKPIRRVGLADFKAMVRKHAGAKQ
jgi:hypothetical protein